MATGQLGKDRSVGARLAWTLPGGADVKSVRVAVAQGVATPTSTQAAAGIGVVVTRFGATLTKLRAGATYTVAVYTVDAAGNVSAGVKTTLLGTKAAVKVSATSTAGRPIVVRGSLSDASGNPLAKMPVEMLTRTAGSRTWHLYRSSVTSAKGLVFVTAKPMSNSEFALRFAGDRGRLGLTASLAARVDVHATLVATLHVGSGSGGIDAPLGSVARLSGRVTPGKPGKKVELQKLVNRKWTTVAVTRMDGNGNFSFVLSTSTKGKFAYKVYRPFDASNLAGGSNEQYLRVR